MNSNELEKYFIFIHQGVQYAMPVMNVLEVVEVEALSPFHGELAGCMGNLVHRGHVLPVLNPNVLRTGRARSTEAPSLVVVVESQETVFGLALDHHLAVTPLQIEAAETTTTTDPSPSPSASAADSPLVASLRTYRDDTIVTFSIPSICDLVKSAYGDQRVIDSDRRPGLDSKEASEQERRAHLCARIEDTTIAIPVEQVVEVIEEYDVTPLFKVDSCLRGLINLRGQILACVDISPELGFRLRPLETLEHFVVLQCDGQELALCVDKVQRIRSLDAERIQPTDTVLVGEIVRYVAGVVEDDGVILVLSVPGVFDSPRLSPYRSQDA